MYEFKKTRLTLSSIHATISKQRDNSEFILEGLLLAMSIENEQDYEADLVVLLDDEGNEHEFEIIDEIENDDGYFMALIPTLRDAEGEIADADEYYIFEVVNVDGEEQLSEVEDEELLDKLADIFESRYAQAMEEEEE